MRNLCAIANHHYALANPHMLKAKGREGVVTFGYQTISMDDISPMQQTEHPMNEPNIIPFVYDTDDSTKKPEEHDFMVIG